MIGQTISHYRVMDQLGRGGMGVIYRAEDTSLGRAVALKFLPEEWSRDEQALERFKREARAAAALNHPNICTVYEIAEHQGRHFIAMELLEGETLRERLAAGASVSRRMPPPLDTLLDLAVQIADGLHAAHAKGIVHRDIKPGNIFLTVGGRIKILDFGLAKLMPAVSGVSDRRGGDEDLVATADAFVTMPGMAMGTVSYMSPEQARGEETDARTDLFSFGAVLYEMATGRQAFPGQSAPVVFQALLGSDPVPPRQLNSALQPELERIILRALEKDREVRYQTASDLGADLKRLRRATESGHVTALETKPRRKPWGIVVGVGAGALALALGLALILTPPLPLPRVKSYTPITSDAQTKGFLVTDGARVYFDEEVNGQPVLHEVSAAGGETVPIATTLKGAWLWAVAPDSSKLLVTEMGTGDQNGGALWEVPLPGGSARRVGNVFASAATWSPDGRQIAYTYATSLYVTPSEGGDGQKLVTLPGPPSYLRWSPDGSVLRFNVENKGIWEVSADGSNLHGVGMGLGEAGGLCCGDWTRDGKYFAFVIFGKYPSIGLRREKGEFFRRAGVAAGQLTNGPIWFGEQTPSPDGKRLYAVGSQPRGQLVRWDSKAREFIPFMSGMSAEFLSFSKDGQWVAYLDYPHSTIFRSKVDGSEKLQLTTRDKFNPAIEPVWSPDGKRIAFLGARPGKSPKIYLIKPDGTELEEPVPGEEFEEGPSWSPDGKSLAFGSRTGNWGTPQVGFVLHRVDLQTRKVTSIAGSKGLYFPRWSPDGQYLVALTPSDPAKLKMLDLKTGKWADLSELPAEVPAWSHDGTYVYFVTRSRAGAAIMRVRVRDKKAEQVASLKGIHQEWGEDRPWFGLAPDDSSLIDLDAGTQDIYALDLEMP
jgi:eukaryotic-like serine/threonine-protein kinase